MPGAVCWRRRRLWLAIGGAAVGVLLCLAAAEILLTDGQYRSGRQRAINLREHRPLFQDTLYPTQQDLDHAEALPRGPYRLRIDAQGFIEPAAVHDRAQVTLVFLGGSTTECLYMEETQRFPYQVGRRLEQLWRRPVHAFNAGKAGNNSLHSLNVLVNKIIPLRPDLVIMLHNINDLIILLYEGSYWNSNRYKTPILEITPTVGKSLGDLWGICRDAAVPRLARAVAGLRAQWDRPAREFETPGRRLEIQPDRLTAAFRTNLQLFVEICRIQGLTPVLLTQASRFTPVPDDFTQALLRRQEQAYGIVYEDFQRLFARFNEEIRTVGQTLGISVIDLARAIPPDAVHLYDAVHLTPQGAALAAEVISTGLEGIVRERAEGRGQ